MRGRYCRDCLVPTRYIGGRLAFGWRGSEPRFTRRVDVGQKHLFASIRLYRNRTMLPLPRTVAGYAYDTEKILLVLTFTLLHPLPCTKTSLPSNQIQVRC